MRPSRPKLTLRDLFAVVTIVALALGWLVDRSRLMARIETQKYIHVKPVLYGPASDEPSHSK